MIHWIGAIGLWLYGLWRTDRCLFDFDLSELRVFPAEKRTRYLNFNEIDRLDL